MRRHQWDHAVAEHAESVDAELQPPGQPISASTNSGFKVRRMLEVSPPSVGVAWTWWERSADRLVPAEGLIPSIAIGVAHSVAAVASPSPLVGLSPLRLWLPSSVGVGHARVNADRKSPLVCP